ncbi:chromate efflux transporter [Camelliibacillus cellulosilyticus]|uniref:Chromate efflux transporter n=1 Tax=Camelliibacillus cellulosilyticus TaxID=2174486 RepID=A0ABV9GKH5_9BACL
MENGSIKEANMDPTGRWRTWVEILAVSTKLGLTSFGGPIAHLGYFRHEYIEKRKWLDDRSYADLVALCQFLPGPASSQVGMSIGMLRGGFVGGIVSWFGFTWPSVLLLVLFAYLFQGLNLADAGWIMGLKIVAVAVVAQAIFGMGKKLASDSRGLTVAVMSAIIMLVWPSALGQIGVIVASGIAGLFLYKNPDLPEGAENRVIFKKRTGVVAFTLFFVFLIGLPLLRQLWGNGWLLMFDTFYRVGALVFGGGHVVLPLLQQEVVPNGWVSEQAFLAGYGAAQAVPGPLFTFAGYLGAMIHGWTGAIVTTIGIFLSSFFLVIGALTFWGNLRRYRRFQSALLGINASVVGILLAAFYHPVFTSAIRTPMDFALALAAFAMLMYWKLPPWIVVLFGAIAGYLLSLL